jgi:hypothetical protein
MGLALDHSSSQQLTAAHLHLLARQQLQQQQQRGTSGLAKSPSGHSPARTQDSSSSSSSSDVPVVISSLTRTYLEDLLDQVGGPCDQHVMTPCSKLAAAAASSCQ